ncbi:hypothetical protein LINPERPRIM_LOCUS18492 [Linum perenne]
MGLLAGARKIGKLMSDKAVECMVRNPTYKLASVSFVRSGYNRTARLFNPAYTLETPPDDVIVRKSARLLVDSASLFGVFFGYNRTARLFNPAYTLETPPDDVIVRKSARLLVDSASLFISRSSIEVKLSLTVLRLESSLLLQLFPSFGLHISFAWKCVVRRFCLLCFQVAGAVCSSASFVSPPLLLTYFN